MTNTPFYYPASELNALTAARNYYREIISRFRPYLGERVIEVGAGIGTFAEHLMNSVNPSELVLLEPTENLFPILQKKYGADCRVKLLRGFLRDFQNSHTANTLILVNVLEHVEDDAELLETARRMLEPKGTLLLFVPALPWLYGSLDRAFDHHRRYTKAGLKAKIETAGFRVEHLRYVNFPGVLGWYVAGRLLKRQTIQRHHVHFYDRWVLPWCFRLEKAWEPPLGQSLLAVAQRD